MDSTAAAKPVDAVKALNSKGLSTKQYVVIVANVRAKASVE